jgi:hypothetical protein
MSHLWHRVTKIVYVSSCLASAPLLADIYDDFLQERAETNAIERSFCDELDLDLYSECFDSSLPTKQLPPELIIELLLAFNAVAILESPFYLHTNPLNRRNILDSPLFEYHYFDNTEPWRFNIFAFYNKTNRCNFTKHSTKISSYLALSSPTLIGAIVATIENLNTAIPNFSDLDVVAVFDILQKIRVEERNIGLMLSGVYRWEKVCLQLMVPLLYHERNFFLTPEQLDDLADQLGEAEDNFQKKHVISDKFGFGDTRLELGFHTVEKPSIDCTVGLLATIPTAFVMAKNFFGSSFPKPDTYPEVDFNTIYQALEDHFNGTITLHEQNEVIAIARKFILDAIDRFAANIIDDPLGNNGHFGIGAFGCMHSPLTAILNSWLVQDVSWNNRVSFEYLWPKKETRFYIKKDDPQDFASRDFEDVDQAADNLIFLQNELIQRINTLALKTNVQPGVIFRWTSALDYAGECWKSRAGINLWIQNKPKLGFPIRKTCDDNPTINQISALDLCKVQSPLASQFKIFGDCAYHFTLDQTTWAIGLNGDVTVLKTGIGADFTLGLTIEATF